MSDGLVAMPGDPDLNCYLTGVRIRAIADLSEPHWMEIMLSLDTSHAAGWYGHPPQAWEPGDDVPITLAAAAEIPRRYRRAHAAMMAVLARWQDEGTPLVMTSAHGRFTRLSDGYQAIPLPPASRPAEASA